jgi:hypothetical protein
MQWIPMEDVSLFQMSGKKKKWNLNSTKTALQLKENGKLKASSSIRVPESTRQMP